MPSTKTMREAMALAQANANRDRIPWCIFHAAGRYYVETTAPKGKAVHWNNPIVLAPEYRAILDASDIQEF